MKLIYTAGFSKAELLEWKPVVFNNIVQAFRLIYDAMGALAIEFENKENEVGDLSLNGDGWQHADMARCAVSRKIWRMSSWTLS